MNLEMVDRIRVLEEFVRAYDKRYTELGWDSDMHGPRCPAYSFKGKCNCGAEELCEARKAVGKVK